MLNQPYQTGTLKHTPPLNSPKSTISAKPSSEPFRDGMETKFLKRQQNKQRKFHWFFKSGVLLLAQPRYLRRPRPQKADNWLAQEDSDRLLRQRALYAAQMGDFAFALQGFNCLIERNPQSAADYNNRGLVYFQSGQLASALADYNSAIAIDPNLANVYNNRANYYAALGELSLAIEDYDQAIRIDPMNVRAWINQGITFREMELYEQAIENFSYALDINQGGDNDTTRLILEGHIFAERGRCYHLAGDWNCAITEYHHALDLLERQQQMEISAPLYLRQQLEDWLKELTQPLIG
jgi:tetratricopeptide (TPR) repeat protein